MADQPPWQIKWQNNWQIWWPRVELTWADHVADQLADLPPGIDIWWPIVELTWADQVADQHVSCQMAAIKISCICFMIFTAIYI